MIRITDILISFFALIILLPLIFLIYFLIYLQNKSPIFKQVRMGKNMKRFTLIKFRTMNIGTESLATHLIDDTKVTNFGGILRKTKLDELPQLWNVLRGDMSLVGPRPCLPSQFELIDFRQKYDLYKYLPGITGLAQINGIDMSDPILLANTDYKMMKNLNLKKYFYYLLLTFFGSGFGDRVKRI
ncbi:MAG: sugar transferase [Prochlorococcus marinus CUG1438]|nr:sugar transferase [Prochlorococcus marinus CUG1438]